MLTTSDYQSLLDVLNGNRQRADGSIRMDSISAPVKKLLLSKTWIFRDRNGKHYPRKPGTGWLYEAQRDTLIRWDWRDLPADVIWFAVAPMLREGKHAGHSITRSPRWNLLDLYFADQYGYQQHPEKWEGEIMQVLNTLDQHGYIWFQFAGSVWEITRKERAVAA